MISIESLYKCGQKQMVSMNNLDILVTNISETGIGFQSKVELPVDYFFNCRLDIPKSTPICCVVRIIRTKKLENTDGFEIGCELIGLSSIYSHTINEYISNLTDE